MVVVDIADLDTPISSATARITLGTNSSQHPLAMNGGDNVVVNILMEQSDHFFVYRVGNIRDSNHVQEG